MAKAKKGKKPHHRKQGGLMGRSDIPYAMRMAMDRQSEIVANRDHAARIAMFCNAYALNELEGIGYKRLVKFSLHHLEIVNEVYEDTDLGMARLKRRLGQMGIEVSGELFTSPHTYVTKREWEIQNHRMQATQIALMCGVVAMNDLFEFGKGKQERISNRVSELTSRYAKEGEKFLLDKMAEIGFEVVNGEARAYMDDDGNVLTPNQWHKAREKEAKA